MTGAGACTDGVARHLEIESFRAFAWEPLQSAAPWIEGICFNPACSRAFRKARAWQIYCCPSCERAGNDEFRKWGRRMALPLLVHRIGKYERHDEGVRALNRAARRYLTYAQSEWLRDRQQRVQGADRRVA